MRRYAGYAGLGCLAIVLLLLFLIYGEGNIAERVFEFGLHRGMAKNEVVRLQKLTGGDTYGKTPTEQDVQDLDSGATAVWYQDWWLPCVAGGRLYVLYFDANQNVRSWRSERWTDGC